MTEHIVDMPSLNGAVWQSIPDCLFFDLGAADIPEGNFQPENTCLPQDQEYKKPINKEKAKQLILLKSFINLMLDCNTKTKGKVC